MAIAVDKKRPHKICVVVLADVEMFAEIAQRGRYTAANASVVPIERPKAGQIIIQPYERQCRFCKLAFLSWANNF